MGYMLILIGIISIILFAIRTAVTTIVEYKYKNPYLDHDLHNFVEILDAAIFTIISGAVGTSILYLFLGFKGTIIILGILTFVAVLFAVAYQVTINIVTSE